VRSRLAFLGVGIALLVALASAQAEEGKVCTEFYDAAKGDRGAADVYIGVGHRGTEPACFLVPRVGLERGFRPLYSDGSNFHLPFDPVDLREYLGQATSIMVGSEQRTVETDELDCLKDPAPETMAVMPGPVRARTTLATLNVETKETATDFPGYRRFSDRYGGDHYIAADAGEGAAISFWCAPEVVAAGAMVCGMSGAYDDQMVVIRYLKKNMTGVKPENALQCVRTAADLFRIN
jgi:hypothetical protein